MVKIFDSTGYKVFSIFNCLLLSLLAILCFLPLVHVLAISLNEAVTTSNVTFWPVDFTAIAYKYIMASTSFWRSMWISIERVALGTLLNMILTIIVAYPLSKDARTFRHRRKYVWIFMVTMLFSGGLIPWYLTIKFTGLIDKLGALIIPGAVSVYNIVLLLNFFRQLPRELEEAAFIDGAGHWTVLWKIFVPTSTAAIATLTLFSMVGHWNSWFDGLILMNRPENYPLQSYMQTIVISQNFQLMTSESYKMLQLLSNRTVISAQIFVGAVPILIVYPFLQKYFAKGIVLGSVKG
ncbi:MAG: ABC transporter permease [Clostridiales bacterium GWC2_40_7]|nr:MAG: ABC transporter permease [Clostridiales bacterium GWC2_40_7]